MLSISIIYASTGGHAKTVATRLSDALVKATASASVIIDKRPAGLSRAEDLLDADVLVLVSAEAEGEQHLHEQMHTLLFDRATDIDLDGRCVACVSLSGDEETADILMRKFQEFIDAQNGKLFAPYLLLTGKDISAYNEETEQWADKLLRHLQHHQNRKPLGELSSLPHSI